MENRLNTHWFVKQKGEAIGIVGADSSVICVLSRKRTDEVDEGKRIKEAYLLASAPQLLEVCCKLNSLLENSLIVTPEGFKIECSDVRKALSDVLLRARGYRKAPHEP